jgi:YidC/Oxa1 family membrane protein insertase
VCGQSAHPCGDIPAAHFLFIPDITDKATGAVLVALIVVYVGTQLISGLITTFTADRTQRIMMLALPFLFVSFVINFPAGLIVYWITTNLWTIGQQLAIKKFLPPPEPLPVGGAVPAGARAATDGKAKKPAKPAKAEASGSNGAQATKAPPPGPRKKKKRSGRRR